LVLTGGEASDHAAVPALMAMPVGKPRLLLADKAYDGDAVRQDLLLSGILPVIPPKANRKNPPQGDCKTDKDRNRIERMFNRLKQFRRIATRFDKTAKSFAAFLALEPVPKGLSSWHGDFNGLSKPDWSERYVDASYPPTA
jgi:transposase